MTNVYFVRHAQPNYNNHDDFSRELTEKGLAERPNVQFLMGLVIMIVATVILVKDTMEQKR